MKLEKSWYEKLKNEIAQPYIQELKKFLEDEKNSGKTIYPPEPLVFNSFLQTPFDKVKVVIVGQDPYHGAGQAHGRRAVGQSQDPRSTEGYRDPQRLGIRA